MAAKTQEQIYAPQPDAEFSPRLIIVDLSHNTTETVYVKADVAVDWSAKHSFQRKEE